MTLSIILLTTLVISCSKSDTTAPAPTIVKQWTIAMSAKNENPAPVSRTETGTAVLELLSDNSLKYTITVVGLTSGDAVVAAHLHVGNVITNGGVIQDLSPVFNGGTATGTVTNLRSTFVDSLKDDVNEIYINAHSSQVGSGLIRGQLNAKLDFVADVVLNGANEVPATTTTATGLALIRLTTAKQLYIKLTTTGIEAGDAFSAAHIHKAAIGVNGSVFVGFYSSNADFGTTKISTVDDATITSLKADAIYVNAHSTTKPGGLIRGQIR